MIFEFLLDGFYLFVEFDVMFDEVGVGFIEFGLFYVWDVVIMWYLVKFFIDNVSWVSDLGDMDYDKFCFDVILFNGGMFELECVKEWVVK